MQVQYESAGLLNVGHQAGFTLIGMQRPKQHAALDSDGAQRDCGACCNRCIWPYDTGAQGVWGVSGCELRCHVLYGMCRLAAAKDPPCLSVTYHRRHPGRARRRPEWARLALVVSGESQSRAPCTTASASTSKRALLYRSATCWFTGRDLYQAQGGSVPIGLVLSTVRVGGHS